MRSAQQPGAAQTRALRLRRCGGREFVASLWSASASRASKRSSSAAFASASGAPDSAEPGSFRVPILLNTVPHSNDQRALFAADLVEATLKALRAGKTRLRTFQEHPELNTALDTYNLQTLLRGIRELVFALARDGKRVRLCVQKSMGQGMFTAMPLSLAGVRRILDEFMEWNFVPGAGDEPGNYIRIGAVAGEEVQPDDDILILIAPQHIVGYSLMPRLQALCEAAGERPVVMISPRLTDIPSSGGVMSYAGRSERLDFLATFEECYHFRLIYNKPSIFPIYGALRHVYGEPWELYKRVGRMETEEYRFAQAWPVEPSPSQITDAIAKQVGPTVYDPAFPERL